MGVRASGAPTGRAMLSVERCREVLGPGCGLSDAELARLRDELYALSTVAVEVARDGARASQRLEVRRRVAGLDDVLVKLPEAERADVIERASIIEFDGGRPRDEAERLAVHGVLGHLSRTNHGGARTAKGREP